MKHLLRITTIVTLLLSSLLYSCDQNEFDLTSDDTPSIAATYGPNFKFIADPNLYDRINASKRISKGTDPFTITAVKRAKDKLIILVTYSGGCKAHSFNIFWDGSVNIGENGKVNLVLQHDAHGDECEALVTDAIEIEVNKYFNNIVEPNNTVFKVKNNASSQEVYSKTTLPIGN